MAKKPKHTTAVTAISKISDKSVLSRDAAVVVIYGDSIGRKYDLKNGTTTFGRSPRSTIQVDQESVSRNHAKLENDDGSVEVRDAGSTNGTFVNDEPVEGAFLLRNGDLIKIGRTVFRFIASNNIEAAYYEEIYRLTTTDGLTQAYNRRYFEETLEREISRARRHQRGLGLVMFDIDRFKRINDEYGHLAGDMVLKEMAGIIRERIRREDVLARYGGEEFGLVLPEVDVKGALVLAEKLRKLVEKHAFAFDRVKIPVTISLGVAALAKKVETPADLVRRADQQLYAAKHGGRNQVSG